MLKGLSSHYRIVLFFLCAITLAEAVILLFTRSHLSTLEAYASDVLQRCSGTKFPPSCYDEEIPKLMDSISMEQAFEVTWLVQEKDPKYLYCHVLAHNLSYRESQKDPDKWKDVLTRCPTTRCNNGCLHGSMMQRFNSESLTDEQIEKLKPDLTTVCEPRGEWNPVNVEKSMCYHSLGHLNMFITNADMRKSAALCEFIGTKSDGRNYVQTCTEGVFMSIFQPLEPEDFALVKDITPAKAEVASFCKPYSGISFHACRREAWPLFRTELMRPEGLAAFCSYAEDDQLAEKTCYAAIMNMVTVNLIVDDGRIDKMKEYCTGLPKEVGRSQCFANAATRLIQIDPRYTLKAVEVCQAAAEVGLEAECERDLAHYSLASFRPGSKEFIAYCEELPEPVKIKCLKLSQSKGDQRVQ